jgi:hypothetical protein
MKSTYLALGLAALGVLSARNAAAQEATFGTRGRFIIAGERLVGYTVAKTERKYSAGNNDVKEELTDTQFDFTAKGSVHDPFAAPRLAFDYFVIDALSIGGALGYASHTQEGEVSSFNSRVNTPDIKENGFVVAPRVGYCYMFSPVIGIWPRGGFTYWSIHQETDAGGVPNDTEDDASGFNLSIEAMLAIVPVEHGAFLVGPTLDFPLSGSGDRKRGNDSRDWDRWKITSYGIQAGIGVWF